MKKILLGVALALGLCCVPQHAQAQVFTKVNLAWSTDGNPGTAKCSTSVTSNCKNGYVVQVTPPGATTPTALSPLTDVTLLAVSEPIPQPAGNYTYGVAVTGLDGSGHAMTGVFATVVVAVPFIVNQPQGLTGTLALLTQTLTNAEGM